MLSIPPFQFFGRLSIFVGLAAAIWLTPSRVHSQSFSGPTKVQIGSLRADVKINETGEIIALQWIDRHGKHTQKLVPPNNWFAWPGDSCRYQPNFMFWPITGQHVLIVIGGTPSAAYGISAPLIYSLRGHSWKLVERPELLRFTNRGGFYIQGTRLYLWDYEMNAEQAHSAPQRYWLKIFSLRSGRIIQIEKRLTRRKYLGGIDFESDIPPEHLPAEIDPLREFGLKWQWWGWNNQKGG